MVLKFSDFERVQARHSGAQGWDVNPQLFGKLGGVASRTPPVRVNERRDRDQAAGG
ncbi:hypothetical protein [Mycobacterium sp. TY815]|uniref:hypothetical protein n=1 Tax=Mycobacterium sp. TY815 TaxID=3050581 RepID=UPI0027419DB0|nr:hypothetical protein [Mycobacterium sp. TY815]MDP7703242.1 hypothetical protein [Mycobacterium sp. TY815]